MSELIRKVEENILENRLLRPGDAVLVAVSGGVDSMLLMEVLHRLAPKHRWRLAVAHLNHRLRGQASRLDAAFVQKRAKQHKIEFVTGQTDVAAFAKKQGVSIEMAARQLRHEFLARSAHALAILKIATAHHADDQLELFFLRLLRGAGGEGLAGMDWTARSPADSTRQIIRPFLNLSKADLESLAREWSVPCREDATNQDTRFERNWVRHRLIPILRARAPHGLEERVTRLMELAGSESDFVKSAALAWLGEPGKGAFALLHEAVQRQVLCQQLIVMGVKPNFALVEHLRQKPGEPVVTSPNQSIQRDPEGRIISEPVSKPLFDHDELELDLASGSGSAEFGGKAIRWKLMPNRQLRLKAAERVKNCEYFDANQVGDRIRLRFWQPGDRFQPIGMPGPVKLQDLFTNLKIPRPQRHLRLIGATFSNQIFWLEGARIGDPFKITPQTRRVLKWQWQGIPD